MKPRHFDTAPESARDLRLASLWIAALLLAGGAANVIALLAEVLS